MKLMKRSLAAATIILSLAACQKEISEETNGGTVPNGNTSDIIGNYDMVGMSADLESTTVGGTAPLQTKTIITVPYTSTDNKGTVKITADSLSTTDVSYTLSGNAFTKVYVAGVLIDTMSFLINTPVPATSNSGAYTKVGTDSLHFAAGAFGSLPAGIGVTLPATPNGARYSWSADTLVLKIPIDINTTQTISGNTVQITAKGTQIAKLKKK